MNDLLNNVQVTSGDTLHGPEGVEISLLPAEYVDGDSNVRHAYTVMEGRYSDVEVKVIMIMISFQFNVTLTFQRN